MINPRKITDFNRSTHDLQEMMIFSLAVAGKRAHIQSHKVHAFIHDALAWTGADLLPFDRIRIAIEHDRLEEAMRAVGLGKYALIGRGLRALVEHDFDLRTVTPDELEQAVPGCSFKTARFFITHTQADTRYAVIDTWVLRYLRDLGIDAPTISPQNKKVYERLERSVHMLIDLSGKSAAEFDQMLWNRYSRPAPAGYETEPEPHDEDAAAEP